MSNKPIEPGCRVLVIRGNNIGAIGVAIEKIDPGVKYQDYPIINSVCWVVESLSESGFKAKNVLGRFIPNRKVHVFRYNTVIRLPDEDDVEEFDKEKELENV